MQEANRFGNVSSGFLPHSKCLKNFSTCDQTQLQKIYKQSRETAKVIVEIQAARGQLCLRGSVLSPGAPSEGEGAQWAPCGALIRTVDGRSSCKQWIL